MVAPLDVRQLHATGYDARDFHAAYFMRLRALAEDGCELPDE